MVLLGWKLYIIAVAEYLGVPEETVLLLCLASSGLDGLGLYNTE